MGSRFLLWLYLLSAAVPLWLWIRRRDLFPFRYPVCVVATGVAAGLALYWPRAEGPAFVAATVGFLAFLLLPGLLVRAARGAARRRRFGWAARMIRLARLAMPARFLEPEQRIYEVAREVGAAPAAFGQWLDRQAAAPGGWRAEAATRTLAVSFTLVYLGMMLVGHPTSLLTLLELGASYGTRIREGEYFRLFTAMFLHIGVLHLAMNLLATLIVGRWVEPSLGAARTILVFLLGGLVGNVASLALYGGGPDPLVSAGASGGVMALLGAALVIFLRSPPSPERAHRVQSVLLIVVATILLGVVEEGIDNGAHLGGLASGAVLALVLTGRRALPDRVVRIVATLLVAMTLSSFAWMLAARPAWTANREFSGPGFSFTGPAFLTRERDLPLPTWRAGPFGRISIERLSGPSESRALLTRETKRLLRAGDVLPAEASVMWDPPEARGDFLASTGRIRTPAGTRALIVAVRPLAGNRYMVVVFDFREDDDRLDARIVRPVLRSFTLAAD